MESAPSPLRYGLIVHGHSLPDWQVRVLESLDAVDGVALCVVVVDRSSPESGSRSPENLVWRLFDRVISRRSATTVDVSRRWVDVPKVEVRTEGERDQVVSARDVQSIAQHRPHFLLRLGGSPVADPILDAVPLGVWSFGHGAPGRPGAPDYLRELIDDDATTAVLLQRSSSSAPRAVTMSAAIFPTISHSIGRNRDQALQGAVELPAQMCRRLLVDGPGALDGGADTPVMLSDEPPTALDVLRFLPKLVARWFSQQAYGLMRADHWQVGVVDRPLASFLEDQRIDDARWLPRPGTSRYVADPFGCPSSDGITVLVEDYDHQDRHGRIAAYRLPRVGPVQGPIPVKDFPHHASYPSLTRVNNAWWCVPETAKARKVQAFEFDPDSLELRESAVLLEGVALADPTLFEWQGRWWLLGTDYDAGPNTHLRGWWAPEPEGPWTPHAIDPLVIDVRSARPAGTPFVVDGELYRPAQDCSLTYGGAVVINRVTRLDPAGFAEEPATRIEPAADGRNPNGIHTLARVGDATLIDGTRHRFSMPAFRYELAARLGRLAGTRGR